MKIKHIVYIDKSMKDKDLAILDKTLCTMKGAKIYEEYMKNIIFNYVNENLENDEFWDYSEENKILLSPGNENEFLEALWLSEDFFYYIDDELIKNKEKLNAILHLDSVKDVLSHTDVVYGAPHCPARGQPWEFTKELKQEAINREGLVTCPHCKESAYIFDLYNHFYIEIFDIYMKEVHMQKFKAWVRKFRDAL